MWNIEWLDTTPSTQSDLKQRLLQNPQALRLVLASENQTQGFGRKARVWLAPIGNLSFSLSFAIAEMSQAYQFNLLASFILLQTLEKTTHIDGLRIKWPNDVWYQDKKLAGILSECLTERNAVILGVGLNLNSSANDFPFELQKQIVTLKDILGETISATKVLSAFLANWDKALTQFAQHGLSPFLPQIKTRLQFLNEAVCLLDDGRVVAEGIFTDISPQGWLVLRDQNDELVKQMTGDLTLKGFSYASGF